jgi:hypothetical protein
MSVGLVHGAAGCSISILFGGCGEAFAFGVLVDVRIVDGWRGECCCGYRFWHFVDNGNYTNHNFSGWFEGVLNFV